MTLLESLRSKGEMSPSDSFPVSEAEDEGTPQLFIRAKQGGIVRQRRSHVFCHALFCEMLLW